MDVMQCKEYYHYAIVYACCQGKVTVANVLNVLNVDIKLGQQQFTNNL
jgi:hypothetical protein